MLTFFINGFGLLIAAAMIKTFSGLGLFLGWVLLALTVLSLLTTLARLAETALGDE